MRRGPRALSRREALGLAALAPLASSCARTIDTARMQGSIVGPAVTRGHAWRDGSLSRFPKDLPEERVDCLIAGGGIAGLSAAWALDRAGADDFLVLEFESAPGGTSIAQRQPVTAPWGAHYVPVPDPANEPLCAVLEEAGAITSRKGRVIECAEDVLCRDPQERLFVHDRWYEGLYPRVGASLSDAAEFDRFHSEIREMAMGDAFGGKSAFAVPRWRSADHPDLRALDTSSMAEWLARCGYRSERLRWWIDYACRDDFGATLEQTSAWAGLFYFVSRHQVDTDSAAEFLTWPEGNGRLVDVLSRRAGSRVRTGRMVTEMRTDGPSVVVRGFDSDGAPFAIRARTAICALPTPFAARVVNADDRDIASSFVYGSWMVANLTIDKRPADRGFPLAWDNVIYDSESLGYVVTTHQAGIDRGATVFTYYRPFVDDDPRARRIELLSRTWESWTEEILADLGRAHADIRRCVSRIDVMVWGHAMVKPRPGFLCGDVLARAGRSSGRIHFAHTDLSGLSLFEEAQDWGIRAAEASMRDLGHAYRPWWKSRG